MEAVRIIHTPHAQMCERCGNPTLNRIHTPRGALCGRCFCPPPDDTEAAPPVVPLQQARRAPVKVGAVSRLRNALNPFRRGGVVR